MKVGIDTFGCDSGRSGLGSYVLSLVQNLPQDSLLSYDLFGSEIDRYTYTVNKNYSFKSVNVSDSLVVERLWHLFKVNSFAKKNKYDVVLYTAGPRVLPRWFKVPGVVVVNDIVSSLIQSSKDYYLVNSVKKSLASADCIIASSQFIKQDIERLGVPSKRIEVIYNGINHSLFYPVDIVGSQSDVVDIKPFAIKKPYLIYASRIQNEDKKHIELIKAFSLFKQRTHLPHRLVIAGSEGSYANAVHKAAFSSCAASDIFITGYFPHESFPELYRNAEACIFPSVSEGVGLSVLESMACGLPVACSFAGALPEVTGKNALFFDSNNIEEIANAIEKIICDKALREELSKKGSLWAKQFTWETTVSKTISVLKDICK